MGSTRTLLLGTEIFVEEVSKIRAAARVGMAWRYVDEWMIITKDLSYRISP